ncbi:hypothetical protein [Burkholderia pyrrocinia]
MFRPREKAAVVDRQSAEKGAEKEGRERIFSAAADAGRRAIGSISIRACGIRYRLIAAVAWMRSIARLSIISLMAENKKRPRMRRR